MCSEYIHVCVHTQCLYNDTYKNSIHIHHSSSSNTNSIHNFQKSNKEKVLASYTTSIVHNKDGRPKWSSRSYLLQTHFDLIGSVNQAIMHTSVVDKGAFTEYVRTSLLERSWRQSKKLVVASKLRTVKEMYWANWVGGENFVVHITSHTWKDLAQDFKKTILERFAMPCSLKNIAGITILLIASRTVQSSPMAYNWLTTTGDYSRIVTTKVTIWCNFQWRQ